MKTPLFAALLLGALLISSCRNTTEDVKQTSGITFSSNTLERQGGPGCDTEEGACARLEMIYPVAEGANEALVKKINDSVSTTLSRVLYMLNPEDEETKTLDQLADQFLASYSDFLKEVGGYELGWWIESSHEIHLNNPKVISIELMTSSFTGGAHPLGFSETFNFFLPGGQPVVLDSMISDRQGFAQLVEKEFKLARGLPETASLQDEGFFDGGTLALPLNFVFTPEGLYLIYNVYEAAPYALGPTEFIIPYDKLRDLLKLDLVI